MRRFKEYYTVIQHLPYGSITHREDLEDVDTGDVQFLLPAVRGEGHGELAHVLWEHDDQHSGPVCMEERLSYLFKWVLHKWVLHILDIPTTTTDIVFG